MTKAYTIKFIKLIYCFTKNHNFLVFISFRIISFDRYKNVKSFTKLYRKKWIEYNIIKDVRNLFKFERKGNAIKNKVLRELRALFESDEDGYYKLIKTVNAFSSKYIEYKSNGDKDKSVSTKEYPYKIRPYLSDMINDFKTQGEWKIELRF